ncbi:division/cell wall cluster transcriptional repressor MraZ [Erythrobacter crassostreae]|uniref:Division/cell wall cluster transcriptional repressor MraZ n=1 Tax=Erythrobacter crassostreae TaxID=2828328 RepID=A0A9X1JMD9_9SPHN|nr:division/cell wall cluster transcriptional repressor MraZ [Erythrobacter crassostrea]
MSAFEGYNGQAFSPSGDKGRFVLPPAFRKAVKESGEGAKTLCLAVHDRFDCLIGFGLSRIPELHAKLDKEEERAIQMKDFDWGRDVRAQQLFGFEQLPFDDSGRFVMPDHLRDLGNVGDGLYFHGAGDFFFIWNPEELARMDRSFRGAQVTCKKLMAEAEAKAKAKGGKK